MPEVDGVKWTNLHSVRAGFLALHISGGLVGMPLLVATFLFAKNIHKRQPVFINFCITWILYSAVYVLLGHTGKPLHSSICYIQTAFVMAAPPMTGLSTTLVVFKIWWTFRTAQNPGSRMKPRWLKVLLKILLLGSPYITFIVYTITSIGLQATYPGTFDERNGIYCTAYGVESRRWLVPTFCVICIIFMVLFQSLLIIYYVKNRRERVRNFPLLTNSTSRNLVIRIGLFNLYLFVSFAMGVNFIQGAESSWPFMIQAGLPLAGFLCFGTQRDILKAWNIWHGWRSDNGSTSAASNPPRPSARRPVIEYPMDIYQPNTIQLNTSQPSDDHVNKVHGEGYAPGSDVEGSIGGNSSKFVPVTTPGRVYSVIDIRQNR